LVHVLEDNRNAIVIPRPWDFMPAAVANYLMEHGVTPDHSTEVWEHLTQSEAAWKGLLGECRSEFSDMSIMLIRALDSEQAMGRTGEKAIWRYGERAKEREGEAAESQTGGHIR
jgi:hypothetical protein